MRWATATGTPCRLPIRLDRRVQGARRSASRIDRVRKTDSNPANPANAPATGAVAADWGDRLTAHGLRRTPTRLAVLQTLAEARRALSHAELEAALPGPVDRVTLYRVLDSLVEVGLALRQVGADRANRFSLADGGDHAAHSHFHCDDCGRVYCMPVKPPRSPALPPGFALEGAALQFHGHCPDCSTPAAAVQPARR